MTDTEREQFVDEIEELKLKIEELEGEMEERLLEINSNALDTSALFDLAKDRHERLCFSGQPLHSCPDPLCRDACVALGVRGNGDRP